MQGDLFKKLRLIVQLKSRQDATHSPFDGKQDPRLHHESSGEDAWVPWRNNEIRKQGVMDRYERVKCRKMEEHAYSVFCYGSENWSWSQATLNRIKRLETKAMSRLFRVKKRKRWTGAWLLHESLKECQKILVKMNLLFLSSVIAEGMCTAMGWFFYERRNAVIHTLRQVFKWRSTKWWQSTTAFEMKNDPYNHTRWNHKWGRHIWGCVWDKLAYWMGWRWGLDL